MKGWIVMLKKLDNVLFNLLNLGILAFWFYCALQAPNTPAAGLVFVLTAAVVMYILAQIFFKINDIFVERDIQRYINSGFNPRSVRRY